MIYKSHVKILFTRHLTLIELLSIAFCMLLGAVAVVSADFPANPVEQQSAVTVTATVKRAGANLREGPGLQYEVVGRMKRGALLSVIGQYTNDHREVWYKVYVEAFGEVWVASWVVQVSAIIPSTTFTSGTGASVNTPFPGITITAIPGSNTNSGGASNNPPPPATTPDP